MPTKQETFDTIVAHARQLFGKSEWEGRYYLRTRQGRRSFAGCLIPDNKYRRRLEDSYLFDPVEESEVAQLIVKLRHDLGLVRELEWIHHNAQMRHWEARFRNLAKEHGLVYTKPPVEQAQAN